MLCEGTNFNLQQSCETHYEFTRLDEISTAVILGLHDVVYRLIEKFSEDESNQRFAAKKSPLHYAIKAKRYDIVRMFVETEFELDR